MARISVLARLTTMVAIAAATPVIADLAGARSHSDHFDAATAKATGDPALQVERKFEVSLFQIERCLHEEWKDAPTPLTVIRSRDPAAFGVSLPPESAPEDGSRCPINENDV